MKYRKAGNNVKGEKKLAIALNELRNNYKIRKCKVWKCFVGRWFAPSEKFQGPFSQCPDFQHQELRRKLKRRTYRFTAPLGLHMAQLTLFLNP